MLYTVGRKAQGYFKFRNWDISESWTGFSERPSYENAAEVAETLVSAFTGGTEDDGDSEEESDVDELHIVVYTEFKSMMSQSPEAHRIAPMVVEYIEEDDEPHTLYSFEPDATTLFDALLPRYLTTRVYAALLGFRCIGAGIAATGDEIGKRQRRRPRQGPDSAGQP